ncbi:alkaline phosphatase D family protein [Coraliomargarita sp. SDUM461004]|uniref:Alkaline phosphatase D family protein n=1 Tax=Thalassobacterium sedimentorum TaxID=3041258 RepID=A0ABU1AI88_9BACT|nr:alkaline phosphatase D family protein [Coraliomargarita sp. SDUM461004]MDQ8193893.1 alkaline phosphatase D family protein [Coraliomargarita sp. SDUM461004]
MYRILSNCFSCLLLSVATLQADLINGPMLSHLDMREAKIWVQTDAPAQIRIAYAVNGNENALVWSPAIQTDSSQAHTAVATLDQIEPGQKYSYRVEIDGELATAPAKFTSPVYYHDRTPPPDFKIAVGGAHYAIEDGYEPPYQVLGGGYDIFSTITNAKPELMIWAGNTARLRASDWSTRSGYLKRFAHARSIPQLKTLLQSVPNYATWSFGDFGAPNGGQQSAHRSIAESSFEAFWPRPIEVAQLDGIATQFRYADVDFFMLDVISYRNVTPDTSTRMQILGPEQITWLRQALLESTATFKIIIAGAPILNPADSPQNLSYAEREHTELLQMLREAKISGLFFISGGKNYGELTRLVHANSYNLYDLTLGPLTARPGENTDELNFFRQPGSSIFERHFALIEFSGSEEERTLTIRVMSMEGKELWNRSIPANTLQPAN